MEEIWREVPIKQFSKCYEVSNIGRIRNIRTGRILIPKKTRVGYLRVTLCNKEQKTVSVHRLVAIAFIDNPLNKPTVNHINEIKTDNRVENLEWATNAEQNVHGTRLSRAKAHTDYKARNINYLSIASKHDYSKKNMCNRMRTIVLKGGKEMGTFNSQREASRFTNVSPGQISQCVSGQKKSCKGYEFREVD